VQSKNQKTTYFQTRNNNNKNIQVTNSTPALRTPSAEGDLKNRYDIEAHSDADLKIGALSGNMFFKEKQRLPHVPHPIPTTTAILFFIWSSYIGVMEEKLPFGGQI
jgi:hypothetical protein